MSCGRADRRLESLEPRYKNRFVRYLKALETRFPQFDVIVTETRRSQKRQDCLRRRGMSGAVRSNHQDGLAVDIALWRRSEGRLDWRPAVFRNLYRLLEPWGYGLTTGAHLWGWDELHLQVVEAQGLGEDLGTQLEAYDH